jgi:hypothetical protein
MAELTFASHVGNSNAMGGEELRDFLIAGVATHEDADMETRRLGMRGNGDGKMPSFLGMMG